MHFKELIKTKELNIEWYEYTDLLAIIFCLISIVYWFQIFILRNSFKLPIDDT
jgi:hypothetical protein